MNGPPQAPPRSGRRDLVRLVDAATGLLGQALASDDAEEGGLRADDFLADPDSAVRLLGDPQAWPAARHAVVQRYGRVGALLVVGYEGRWHGRDDRPNPPELETLLDHFAELSADELDGLLAGIERAEGVDPDDEAVAARRLLHATYARAARDGTDGAHRAYMAALETVMRQAGRALAS